MVPATAVPYVLAVVAVLLAGCAGNGPSDPGATPTSSPSVTRTATATTTSSPTATLTLAPTLTPTVPPTGTPSAVPTATRTPTLAPTPTPTDACNTAGVICTTVGTGISAFDGDGKPALQTSLYLPIQISFDR